MTKEDLFPHHKHVSIMFEIQWQKNLDLHYTYN